MNELSLHILDIAQNSLKAGAALIEIRVEEDVPRDTLTVTVRDDGHGMDPGFLARAADPFTTTRATRKVGLGLPLFRFSAESTGGSFKLESAPGEGTVVTAVFGLSHIDRVPLGDMASTMVSLILASPGTDFLYERALISTDGEDRYTLDTREVREVMEGISLSSPEVIEWLREYLSENEASLEGKTKA